MLRGRGDQSVTCWGAGISDGAISSSHGTQRPWDGSEEALDVRGETSGLARQSNPRGVQRRCPRGVRVAVRDALHEAEQLFVGVDGRFDSVRNGVHLWRQLLSRAGAVAPVCPALEAQTKCVAEAVALGCGEYQNAAARCPVCPPLVGSPCSSDADCQKFVATYRCDVSRSGGYCTAPCSSADDCSVGGPEVCGEGAAPSFALGATSPQTWCLLGCKSDVQCRSNEGYRCQNISPGDQVGTCDSP